jgi:hypothetical protein
MRLITACLLGLVALGLTAPVAAEAANPRSTSRAKVVKPVTRAAAPARAAAARAPLLSRAEPARQAGRVTTGRQTAKASSPATRRLAARGGQTRMVAEESQMTARGARLTSWTAGLPAASGEQRDCPVGTMSTLARGHDDVVRCMPL